MFSHLVESVSKCDRRKLHRRCFFARFNSVGDAVTFALQFQHALRTDDWNRTSVECRIGIHVGDAIEFNDETSDEQAIASHATDMCARIMDLAKPGQILLTRTVFDNARQTVRSHPSTANASMLQLEWLAHGRYLLKGRTDPIAIYEVGAAGKAPLSPPSDSAKAKRVLSFEEEQTLGWRPASGQPIPGRLDWVLQERLGEGGFGEAWLARHVRLKEKRVFKFCLDPARLRSFKRELTLYRLMQKSLGDRDDIARLLDVRVDSAPYYLESEYVEHGNLKQWLESIGGIDELTISQRLGIVASIADAIAAAHSVGVIHKDIKPSNILIEIDDQRAAKPLLADFGIGVLSDRSVLADHQVTETGFTESLRQESRSSTMGTRLYLPPESLTGAPAATTGDVFALGVILYQMILGDFNRALASGWERDIDDELLRDDIMKCVDGNVPNRFLSAGELATRLRQLKKRRKYLADKKQLAERRDRRQHRRRRLAVALLLFTVLGLALLSNHWRALRDESESTKREVASLLRKVQQLNNEKVERLIQYDVSEGIKLLNDNDYNGALVWFADAIALSEEGQANDDASFLVRLEDESVINRQRFQQTLNHCPRILHTLVHESDIIAVTSDSTGKWVISTCADGKIRVWNAKNGRFAAVLSTDAAITKVSIAHHSPILVGHSDDNQMHVWNLNSMDRIAGTQNATTITYSEFSSNDAIFAVAGKNKFVIWETKKWTKVDEYILSSDEERFAISPTGEGFVTATSESVIWRAIGISEKAEVKLHGVKVLGFSLSGDRLLLETEGYQLKKWGSLGPLRLTLAGPHARLSPCGHSCVSAASGKYSAISRNCILVRSLENVNTKALNQGAKIITVRYRKDGSKIVTTCQDEFARIWDLHSEQVVARIQHDSIKGAVFFGPRCNRLYCWR